MTLFIRACDAFVLAVVAGDINQTCFRQYT